MMVFPFFLVFVCFFPPWWFLCPKEFGSLSFFAFALWILSRRFTGARWF